MFAGKKSAQIREILISESAWEEMTCLFAPSLVLMLLFRVVASKCKYFQEKSWVNDEVSDEDILLLCENEDLRPLIKDEIEHGYKLTYTSLLEELPDYLSRIEAYHAKKERSALIRKIDEII